MSEKPVDKIAGIINDHIFENYKKNITIIWNKPPSSNLGDVSFPLFSIAKNVGEKIEVIGQSLKSKIENQEVVEKVELKGGFLNIFFNRNYFSDKVLKNVVKAEKYGKSTVESSKRVIIEHTSSNPNGPLHIGNFRGSVVGDLLARLYKMSGAAVNVRYYVNDLGRQIAPVVIGYKLLKKNNIAPDTKIDLWIGKIYATMNTLLDIQEIKKEIQTKTGKYHINDDLKYKIEPNDKEEIENLLMSSELDEKTKEILLKRTKKLFSVQKALSSKIPDLFNLLRKLTEKEVSDLSSLTQEYIEEYLKGENKQIVSEYRELTEKALSGHIETLSRFNIFHDDFDRESDIAWSGEVKEILQKLETKQWLRHDGRARLLKNDEIATALRYKEKYNIKHEIPDLILVNSEGIPLYPCRDIAYHLHKLEKFNANLCINVIGKQQQSLQLGVRLALYALNRSDIADKIIHFDYEYVTLVGRKMAGRELEYVTPDELYSLAKEEVYKFLNERDYSEEEKSNIANIVSAASVKISIAKIDPNKAVMFDVKKATDLNENSGPFLLYSFTRAKNIIIKAKEESIPIEDIINNCETVEISIVKDEEWNLIKLIEELPMIYKRAINTKRPDTIVNFSFELCKAFNKFYDNCPVISENDEKVRKTRILIVQSTIKALESLFEVLGIDSLEKM
ncbi:MAG: arginine--tRNA ligase [Candidatus Heimdallarchaeum aukensis]|uniref:arginine--tRNA ligase n=1 Tax=Candidatus Heimdallarchaeum aukensis TaxID=2876573 RepID=A0A9Y1BNH8_9ARCH|nr:MAG: arginine--tRNA ligase [Candidatus Heimdallarchaeum aukensis]